MVNLPRVAVFARNPGLCKRNFYRVAAAYGYPIDYLFCSGVSRAFFTANGGFLILGLF